MAMTSLDQDQEKTYQSMTGTPQPTGLRGYAHRRRMELFHQLPCEIAKLLASRRTAGAKLLDVGCWDGEFTAQYAASAGADLTKTCGLDFFEDMLATARSRGIHPARIDLENERFPYEDGQFDAVVCNQVLEHLKQIYLPLSEIHRVLKVGGHAVISVPNLAALHNRLALLAGKQPFTIRIMGPHVRGFACGAFTQLLTLNDLFVCEQIVPVGWYPLPIRLGSFFAGVMPSLSHTCIWLLRKSGVQAPNWMETMRVQKEQTTYFTETHREETPDAKNKPSS